jgi:PmbA protein
MLNHTTYAVKKGLELGATDVIAKGKIIQNQQVRFSNNKIDIGKTWFEQGMGIFLACNRRVAATETGDFTTIDASLQNLVTLAKTSKESPTYAGIAEGPFHYTDIRSDPQLENLEDVSDFVTAAINKAEEHKASAAGSLQVTNEDVYLSTSGGVDIKDRITYIEISIRCFSEKGGSGHSVSCSPSLKGFNPEKAGEEAGELAQLAENPVQGKEGVTDIIFSPFSWGSLLNQSMLTASAFFVLSGYSMYYKRLEERVASDMVTVTDSPSGLIQPIFDDEGVPVKDTPVIDRGFLKTYLHNTSTAAQFKTDTTANAGLLMPVPVNIQMNSGDYSKDELVNEVKNGLFVTTTWYTRFSNHMKGDFSTTPRDAILKIENGEITGSVKDIRISDNLLEVYKNVEAVGKDRKLVRWWLEVGIPCYTPHVLVRKVRITSSTE